MYEGGLRMEKLQLGEAWAAVRRAAPLIHCITNYVTVNDCANALLACGASPIMADDAAEAEEITSLCAGLDVNIGTLNSRTVESMILAGRRANQLRHPALLDPVGAGASRFRTETALRLMGEVAFTALRGNMSEIRTLTLGGGQSRGVDAASSDALSEENLAPAAAFVRDSARRLRCLVIVTGAIDLISDGERVCAVRNGHPMMARVTGTGCMLSAVTAACLAANPGRAFEAAAAAVCAMGLCGQTAHRAVEEERSGTGSFRVRLIDALSLLDEKTLEGGALY